jgi:hypothetical protein
MSSELNNDPIVIDPTYRFAWASLTNLFSSETDADKFVRAVSPQIRSLVSPGQSFVFSPNPSILFVLVKDVDGKLYFVKWPGALDAWKIYLYEDEKPWLFDKINSINKRLKEFDPFSGTDDLFK